MAYTNGPWQYKDGFTAGIFGPDGELLAGGDPHQGWLELNDDVRLMMCSPELLEALQLLLEGYDDRFDGIESDREDDYLRRKVFALIAKATGKE